MTLQTFYRNYRKAVQKYGLRKKMLPLIRLGSKTGRKFCPITAVCAFKTGAVYDTGKFHYAADEIGLDIELSYQIVNASDGVASNVKEKAIRKVGEKEIK